MEDALARVPEYVLAHVLMSLSLAEACRCKLFLVSKRWHGVIMSERYYYVWQKWIHQHQWLCGNILKTEGACKRTRLDYKEIGTQNLLSELRWKRGESDSSMLPDSASHSDPATTFTLLYCDEQRYLYGVAFERESTVNIARWNMDTQERDVFFPMKGVYLPVKEIFFSHTGLFATSQYRKFAIYDINTQEKVHEQSQKNLHAFSSTYMVLSNDNLVSLASGANLEIWDTETQSFIREIGASQWDTNVLSEIRGDIMVTAEARQLKLWDLREHNPILKVTRGEGQYVVSAMDFDGTKVVMLTVGISKSRCEAYDMRGGKLMRMIDVNYACTRNSVLIEGNKLITWKKNKIYMYDLREEDTLSRVMVKDVGVKVNACATFRDKLFAACRSGVRMYKF